MTNRTGLTPAQALALLKVYQELDQERAKLIAWIVHDLLAEPLPGDPKGRNFVSILAEERPDQLIHFQNQLNRAADVSNELTAAAQHRIESEIAGEPPPARTLN